MIIDVIIIEEKWGKGNIQSGKKVVPLRSTTAVTALKFISKMVGKMGALNC